MPAKVDRTTPFPNPPPPGYGEPPKPKYMILPPVEYDRYYEGNLTIRMVNTLEELRERCNAINPLMLACSFRYEKNCVIYLVEDSIMRKRGWTTGLLLRHEIGHCNGWPSDHPGERPVPAGYYLR
jgi:hypothetical protein